MLQVFLVIVKMKCFYKFTTQAVSVVSVTTLEKEEENLFCKRLEQRFTFQQIYNTVTVMQD